MKIQEKFQRFQIFTNFEKNYIIENFGEQLLKKFTRVPLNQLVDLFNNKIKT